MTDLEKLWTKINSIGRELRMQISDLSNELERC